MKSQGYSFVAPEELKGVFNSKEDLYNLLTLDRKPVNNKFSSVNYFLPSLHKWSMHNLRDVLSGKKKVQQLFFLENPNLFINRPSNNYKFNFFHLQSTKSSQLCWYGDMWRTQRNFRFTSQTMKTIPFLKETPYGRSYALSSRRKQNN